MSLGILEAMVEDLVILNEEGLREEITRGHLGAAALLMFHQHLIKGGLKSWMLDDSTDRHIEILVHFTDDAFEQGVKDIRRINQLFRKVESVQHPFDPEVQRITEEYLALDQMRLVKAYSDSVLLHMDLNDFFA